MEINFPNGKKLRLLVGDITNIRVDAIVNAANRALAGGGGVDGAIHRAGGPSIMRELNVIREKTGGCPTGGAVASGAGSLPAQYVFHAVGPVYQDGRSSEAELLASCYRTCLQLAEEHEVRSISFPSISTGAYGYPMNEAARIALETIGGHLSNTDARVREVLLILFDRGSYDVHSRAAEALFAHSQIE